MEYVNNVPAISFARFIAANLYYDLYDELVESLPLVLAFDKFEDHIVNNYYGRYGELVVGLCITGDGIIYGNTFNSDNDDDKRAKDNDGEQEENGDWRGDNRGAKDPNSRVKEEDGWEESNDKESNEDHSGPGHLGTPGKPSPLDILGKFLPLDISEKFLDITNNTMIILERSKVPR